MADKEFCRIETDFVCVDSRYAKMDGDTVKVYLYCWAMAVKERSEFPKEIKDIAFVSNRLLMDFNDVTTCLQKLCNDPLKLLRRYRGGAIRVVGARSKHAKLAWEDEKDNQSVSKRQAPREEKMPCPIKGNGIQDEEKHKEEEDNEIPF